MKLVIALLTLSLVAAAQTVVVPLSSEDAVFVERIHNQLIQAQKAWEDLQKLMGRRYLVVEKDSPDAGDHSWYPEDDTENFLTNGTQFTGTLSIDNGCPRSPEEQAAHEKAFNEAAEKERKREAEREARSKRIHKGFDGTDSFIFSDDWKYLLPKPPEARPYNPNQIFISPTGTSIPSGLLTDPGIIAK